jgi:hypothetical protein
VLRSKTEVLRLLGSVKLLLGNAVFQNLAEFVPDCLDNLVGVVFVTHDVNAKET